MKSYCCCVGRCCGDGSMLHDSCGGNITFELARELLKKFQDYLLYERRLADHTAAAYLSDINQMLQFWIELDSQSGLTTYLQDIFKKFALSLFYNKQLDSQSVSRKVSCLKSFQKYLGRVGYKIEFSIKNPRIKKKLPTVIEQSDLQFLLDELSEENLESKYPARDKAILELLYSTGIRCNELVNIRLEDVDFDEKFIKICKGKGGKERLVVYGKLAANKLQSYQSGERLLLDSNYSSIYLFLNATGGRLTTRTIQRILENFKRFLPHGKELTPHMLRHSFATHMLAAGACMRVVQELLGHSNLLTTELYTQVNPVLMADFLDKKHPVQIFSSSKSNDETEPSF